MIPNDFRIKTILQQIFNNSTKPYSLGGVKEITNNTEYGDGYFAITIFDRQVFLTDAFEYVKDSSSGKYFVKDGKWIG